MITAPLDSIPICQIELVDNSIVKECVGIPTTTIVNMMAELPATGASNLILSIVALGFILVGISTLRQVFRRG